MSQAVAAILLSKAFPSCGVKQKPVISCPSRTVNVGVDTTVWLRIRPKTHDHGQKKRSGWTWFFRQGDISVRVEFLNHLVQRHRPLDLEVEPDAVHVLRVQLNR